MMIKKSFELALLSYGALAIKLAQEDEQCQDAELPSETEGPEEGFSDALCVGDAPEEYYDPVCYESEWIEFAWLDDPTFWACGKQPEDMEYAMCDIESGNWKELDVYDDLDDAAVCGEMPEYTDYVVCNHESGQWEALEIVTVLDSLMCGDKPADMINAVCNEDSGEWEPVGVVHSTDDPICGARPDDMSENAICDAETGLWSDPFVKIMGCEGDPPSDAGLAVCNLDTGLWEVDYVGMEQE